MKLGGGLRINSGNLPLTFCPISVWATCSKCKDLMRLDVERNGELELHMGVIEIDDKIYHKSPCGGVIKLFYVN